MVAEIEFGRGVFRLYGDDSQYAATMRRIDQVATQAGSRVSGQLAKIGQAFNKLGQAATVGLGATTAVIAGVTKASLKFEDAFAGVRKTVDATEAEFDQLAKNIRELASAQGSYVSALPDAHQQLARIMELAGQLGVDGVENLTKFTETIGMLAMTTNLSAEEGAMALSQFMNIMQTPQDQIDRIGATIVDLGNNFATTERDIVEFAQRIAGAGAVVGLSEAQVLALATAMASLGINAEAGGTAISRIMIEIEKAVSGGGAAVEDTAAAQDKAAASAAKYATKIEELNAAIALQRDKIQLSREELALKVQMWGENDNRVRKHQLTLQGMENALEKNLNKLAEYQGKAAGTTGGALVVAENNLDKFAKIAGMSAEAFKKAWEEDAASALQTFVEGLGKVIESGGDVFGILEDLELSDIRVRDALLRMANGGDILADALTLANRAWGENTALAEEAAKRYATGMSQLRAFKNLITDVAIQIGDKFLPVLAGIVGRLGDFVRKVAPPLIKALGKVADWFQALPAPLRDVLAIIAALAGGMTALGGAAALLGPLAAPLLGLITSLAGPLGLLAIAVASLGTAFATNFLGIQDWVKGAATKVKGWLDIMRTQGLGPAIQAVGEFLGGVLANLVNNLPSYLDAAGTFLRNLWVAATTWVKDNVGPVVDGMAASAKAFFVSLPGRVAEFAGSVGGFLQSAWVAGSTWVKENVGPVVSGLGASIAQAWTNLKANAPNYAASVGAFLRNAWTAGSTWVKENVGPVVANLGETISKAWADLKAKAPEYAATVGATLNEVLNKGIDHAQTLLAPGATGLSGVLDTLVGNLVAYAEANKETWAGRLAEKLAGLIGRARELVDQVVIPVVIPQFNALMDRIQREGLVDYVVGQVETWADQLSKAWQGVLETASAKIDSTLTVKGLSQLVIDAVDGLVEFIDNLDGEVVGRAITDFMLLMVDVAVKIFSAPFKLAEAMGRLIFGPALVQLFSPETSAALETAAADGTTDLLLRAIGKIVSAPAVIIGKLFELLFEVWKGAMVELRDKAAVPITDALVEFVKSLPALAMRYADQIATWFEGIGNSIATGIAEGVKKAAQSVIDAVVNAAKAAWQALQDWLNAHSPSRRFIPLGESIPQGLAAGIQSERPALLQEVAALFEELLAAFPANMQERFKGLGETLSAIAGGLTSFMDALGKLSEYAGGVTTARIHALMEDVRTVVDELIYWAVWWATPGNFQSAGLASAKAIVEALEPVVSFLGPAVDALTALAAYAPAKGMAVRIGALMEDLRQAIDEIIGLAVYFRAGDLAAAALFGGFVGKIIGFIGDAVDSLNKVKDLAPQLATFGRDVARLMDMVGAALLEMLRVSRWRDVAAWEAAAEWAAAIMPAIGAVKAAVEAVSAVADLAPQGGAFAARARRLADMLGVLVLEFLRVRRWRESMDAWKAAGEWATVVAPALGMVKGAVDALGAVAGLDAQHGQFGARARRLADMIGVLILEFGRVRAWRGGAAWKAIGEWATDVAPAIAAIKTAADALAAIAEMALPDAGKIGRFVEALKDIFTRIYDFLSGDKSVHRQGRQTRKLDVAVFATVKAFGETVGALMGGLQAALDVLKGLADYAAPALGTVDRFMADVWRIFTRFYGWVSGDAGTDGKRVVRRGKPKSLTDTAMKIVEGFGGAVGALMAGLEAALALLKGLAEYVSPAANRLDQFEADVKRVFGNFAAWCASSEFEDELLDAVKGFGEALGDLMGGLESALSLLAGLAGYISPAEASLAAFEADVKRLFLDFYTWVADPANGMTGDALGLVQTFGDALGSLMGGLKTALELLEGLRYYIPPTQLSVDTFVANVKAIFESFRDWIVQDLTPAEVDAVGKFTAVFNELLDGLGTALGFMQDLNDGTLPGVEDFKRQLSIFNQNIVTLLNSLDTWITTELNPRQVEVVSRFTATLGNLVGGLSRALEFFVALESARLPSLSKLREYLDLLLALFQGLADGLAKIPGLIDTAAGEVLSRINAAYTALPSAQSWYDKGRSYGEQLAAGIRSATGSVQGALEKVKGLFPASPAKWGPFRELPTAEWVGAWLDDVGAQMQAGLVSLGALPDFAPAPAELAVNNVTVQVSGSWQVRNDADAERIAREIMREARRQGVRV